MKTAIKRENDEFLVISFQHVSGRKVTVNRPRTPKQWAIAHENGHKRENGEFLVISLKHVRVLSRHANPAETQKPWAITHENDHKTRKRRVYGHIFPTCIRLEGHC